MVDHDQTVCCMCGDVGFPDKLFHCTRCRWRFQHSYCSNYYGESSDDRFIEVCDWCQSEERRRNTLKHGGSSKKTAMAAAVQGISDPRSEYSGVRIKLQNHDKEESGGSRSSSGEKGRNSGGSGGAGVPSPRTGTRRYKLLKDVMC